jgi:hypothetical protein
MKSLSPAQALPLMLRFAALTLFITVLVLAAAACVTLQVGIERTPTPDYPAVGTLASLIVTGTHSAAQLTQAAIPATPTPSTGTVSGRICYPSERIPAMTLYFSQPEDEHLIEYPVEENQDSYQVSLEPGMYFVFAWVESYQVGGMYTEAVRCGLGELCTDHTPVGVEVAAGDRLIGVDVCDWVHPEPFLPAPPGFVLPGSQAKD